MQRVQRRPCCVYTALQGRSLNLQREIKTSITEHRPQDDTSSTSGDQQVEVNMASAVDKE